MIVSRRASPAESSTSCPLGDTRLLQSTANLQPAKCAIRVGASPPLALAMRRRMLLIRATTSRGSNQRRGELAGAGIELCPIVPEQTHRSSAVGGARHVVLLVEDDP